MRRRSLIAKVVRGSLIPAMLDGDMSTWFTADLHLGHTNIIRYSARPFSDAEAMNRALIDGWNEVVDEGDDVWILGDFAMGKIDETLPLVVASVREVADESGDAADVDAELTLSNLVEASVEVSLFPTVRSSTVLCPASVVVAGEQHLSPAEFARPARDTHVRWSM